MNTASLGDGVVREDLSARPRGAARSPRESAAFGLLLLFIAAVSVHDAALVVLNQQVILEFEKNPIGRWLIETNGDSVWLFVAVKLFCTSLVCAVLATIYQQRPPIGVAAAGGLAICQTALLYYLLAS